jgi:hypothetical protein
MRRHLVVYLSLTLLGASIGGCGGLDKKPYRDDPMLQTRRPVSGSRIPKQNITESPSEPHAPLKP